MGRKLTKTIFVEATENCPVIPEVKNDEWLESLDRSESELVYIIYGDVCTIPDIVERAKRKGKTVLVHIDLIDGLANKAIAVDFIKKYTRADGIISTKHAMIKRANELGLFSIQRFFMMDGITYGNIERHVRLSDPDIVELMPAGLSKVLHWLTDSIHRPVVASGLTQDKDDIIAALSAGAIAVATSNRDLWNV
ncbi:MAG: glycerol-3-phosphate responsive antiterminator [Eubacterium sp.]|nr:glycerol-3-phosphate responsive antiterminator [Eubacterium sp.]